MKKILLVFTTLSITFGLNAQSEFTLQSTKDNVWHGKVVEKKNNKADVSNWYNFVTELNDLGFNYTQYYTMLFPDSTVRAEFNSGLGYVWKHSFGQILDPTSGFFGINAPPLHDTTSYTVDSIALPYLYNRIQQTNPDTLIISVYSDNQITYVAEPTWSTPRSYGTVEYDSIARKGLNPVQEIVYLLENKDTTTNTVQQIVVPVGLNVNADENMAVTFTYMPGNPFSKDDVVDFVNSTADINGFVIYDGQDVGSTLDNDYYNMGQMVTSSIRYNVAGSTNGWEGQYIPGVAYGNMGGGNRHLNVNFLLTYDDSGSGPGNPGTGINENNVIKYDLRSYPMPVENQFRVTFEPYDAQVAVYEIYDLNGTQVQSYRIDASTGSFDMDLTTLSDGFYVGKFILDNQLIHSSKIVKK